jgi:dipeptidyl aminopeptidase/acylaminoacyl peptidase
LKHVLIGRAVRARRLAAILLATVACAGQAALAAGARPGPEAFFQNPSMTSAKLSPDGRTLAVLVASTSTDRVKLVALDVKTLKPTVLAQFESTDVDSVDWVSDKRLVFQLDDHQASQGDVHEAWGLYAINIDGTYFRQLVTQHGAKFFKDSQDRELLPWATRYIDAADPQHDSDDVYVAVPALFDHGGSDYKLKRLNTITGHVREIETPPGANGWVFDAAGGLRVITSYLNGHEKVMLRDAASGAWSTMAEFDAYTSNDGITPVAIDGDRLFVTATRGRDTRSIYTYDLKTGALSDKPFLQSERYDLYPRFIAQGGKLLGIRYTIDATVTQWLDPGMAALQSKIDELLPETANRISMGSRSDAHVFVVASHSDRVPGLFYLYDAERNKLVALGNKHPEVVPSRMSGMEPVHYAARDGLEIPAWLTVPEGAERKNMPLVVLVHGGPFVRGREWEWNPEVQFLAAQCYAVLEPEFRGSRGYGARLFKAGWKQWGLAMQDDVADGVKWAVAQGLVDPKRVCIAGASYGGYAVLMGLINDPQLYRCGIDWVGVTDIDLIYTANWSDLTRDWAEYGMPRMVGDRVADAAQLKATSPIRNAAKIHAPLLMAYGGEDWRVPLVHGEKMHDELMKQPGADVQWVVYGKEGHGWATLATNIDFWNRAAAFLDKNIGH